MSLEISVVVPDRVFFRDTVKEIILPTLTGQMGVLKGHIPVLTGLDTGLILLRKESSENWTVFVVTGGFALVNNNVVTILVNEAEFGSKISKDDAEKELALSKSLLDTSLDAKKKLEILSRYKKARAKIQAVEQFK